MLANARFALRARVRPLSARGRVRGCRRAAGFSRAACDERRAWCKQRRAAQQAAQSEHARQHSSALRAPRDLWRLLKEALAFPNTTISIRLGR